MKESWAQSLGREDPWEKEIPVFLPGEPHGQRSLAAHSLWGHRVKLSLATEQQQQQNLHCYL